jgi:AraC-like DNA-binding protein
MSEELKACKWCGKPLGKFELHERLHCVYALCERAEESENFARALKKEFDRVGNASYAKDLHMRQLEEANNKLKSKILEITDIAMGKGYAEIRPLRAERDRAVSMVERLIEAGERLSIHSRMVDDIDVWNALVAEWQANQKGDSNV